MENNNHSNKDNILLDNNTNEMTEEIVPVLKEKQVEYEDIEFTPKKKDNKIDFSRKGNFFKYAVGFMIMVVVVFGVSYSYFTYRGEDSRQGDLTSGEVYVKLVEQTATLNINRLYPRTDDEARTRADNYIDFTVRGKNTSETKSVIYTININNGEQVTGKERIRPEFIKIDLQEYVNNEYKYLEKGIGLNDFSFTGAVLANTNVEKERHFRIRLWINDNIIISDTEPNPSYTQSEFDNLFATFSISINSYDQSIALDKIIDSVDDPITINFGNISNNSNGAGLYLLSSTANDAFPIYYYRGEVDDNNVIFGDYCWQIVRTTNTGGIKMIYNGEVTGNGRTCENTTPTDRVLSTTSNYNSYKSSLSDVGYMSNQRYEFQTTPAAESDSIYGRDVEWDGSKYTLIETTPGEASTNKTKDNYHHYSCGVANTSQCVSVRYYYYNNNFINLTGGDTIEDAIYKMTGNGTNTVKEKNADYVLNVNDSLIKVFLENWYENNLTNIVDTTKKDLQDYIEDTVYCNDRTFKETSGTSDYPIFTDSGWNKSGDLTKYAYFGSWNRYRNGWYSTSNTPIFTCPNETDSFSVHNQKAKLNYPIGLLTVDEVVLAGTAGNNSSSNRTYYLYTEDVFSWLMSPISVYAGNSSLTGISGAGTIFNNYSNTAQKVRPVISLKLGVEFEKGGEGTALNPYVVKIN